MPAVAVRDLICAINSGANHWLMFRFGTKVLLSANFALLETHVMIPGAKSYLPYNYVHEYAPAQADKTRTNITPR